MYKKGACVIKNNHQVYAGCTMDISFYFSIVDKSYGTENNEIIESEIKRACRLAKENEGAQSPIYASMLSELGGFYRGLTRYDESVDCFTKAADIMKAAKGADSPDYATCINNRAGSYRQMKEFDKAEEGFAECLAIYERSVGKHHILYSAGLNNCALVALDKGQTDRAAGLLSESAEILRNMPDHLDEYATSLANTAELYRQLGRFEDAEKNLLEAKDVYENKLHDTFTPHYHAILNSLGLVCAATRRFAQAAEWFRESLKYCERYYNTEHREYKATKRNLDEVLALAAEND